MVNKRLRIFSVLLTLLLLSISVQAKENFLLLPVSSTVCPLTVEKVTLQAIQLLTGDDIFSKPAQITTTKRRNGSFIVEFRRPPTGMLGALLAQVEVSQQGKEIVWKVINSEPSVVSLPTDTLASLNNIAVYAYRYMIKNKFAWSQFEISIDAEEKKPDAKASYKIMVIRLPYQVEAHKIFRISVDLEAKPL